MFNAADYGEERASQILFDSAALLSGKEVDKLWNDADLRDKEREEKKCASLFANPEIDKKNPKIKLIDNWPKNPAYAILEKFYTLEMKVD